MKFKDKRNFTEFYHSISEFIEFFICDINVLVTFLWFCLVSHVLPSNIHYSPLVLLKSPYFHHSMVQIKFTLFFQFNTYSQAEKITKKWNLIVPKRIDQLSIPFSFLRLFFPLAQISQLHLLFLVVLSSYFIIIM